MKELLEKIKDKRLYDIASSEVERLEEEVEKWQIMLVEMATKGWFFVDNPTLLRKLIISESKKAEHLLFSVEFWIELQSSEFFSSNLAIQKELLRTRGKMINIMRFFVTSKAAQAQESLRNLLRTLRRELTFETSRAELIMIIREELKERHRELFSKLQNFTLFDRDLVIIELSDQFGEPTGRGPVIGKDAIFSEKDMGECGIYGNPAYYLSLIEELKRLVTLKDPAVIKPT